MTSHENMQHSTEALPRESVRFARRYFDQVCNGNVNAIVEVGVDRGWHANSMYRILKPKVLYLVDKYNGRYTDPITGHVTFTHHPSIKEFSREYLDYIPNHHWIYKWSHEASVIAPNQLDFVYIDASHDKFNLKRDIECWYPKVRIGGIVCGHDFHNPVVEGVVKEIFPNIRLGEGVKHVDMNRYFNAEGNDWWLVKLSGNLKNTASWMVDNEKNYVRA